MRAVLLLLLALLPRLARADRPIVWLETVTGLCFGDVAFGARVHRELGDAHVVTGPRPHGARQEVRFVATAAGLELRVDTFDERDHLRATEMRRLPTEAACDAVLDTAAIVIARAATPLQFRLPPRPARGLTRSPAPVDESTAASAGQPAGVGLPGPPDVTAPVPTATAPSAVAVPPAVVSAPPTAILAQAVPELTPRPSVLGPLRRRARPWELGLTGGWSFPLDDAPSTAAGELTLGYGLSWLGVLVRLGVQGESTSPVLLHPTVLMHTRCIPISLEAWIELALRVGGLRIALGPELSLWRLSTSALGEPRDTLMERAGLGLRMSYRYPIGRVVLGIGWSTVTALSRDQLSISGLGVVGHLPVVALSPELSLTVRL